MLGIATSAAEITRMNTIKGPVKSAGLTAQEAASRLATIGPNHLFTPAPVSVWAIAWQELKEPMILLLMVVGVFYGLWGSLGDTITIFIVIFLLVAVEVGGEFRAKRAIEGLQSVTAPQARLRRGGEVVMVDAVTVVPGDVMILMRGARLAADAKLSRAVNLSIDESTLTGESLPAEKTLGGDVFQPVKGKPRFRPPAAKRAWANWRRSWSRWSRPKRCCKWRCRRCR
jgi:P-type Ca2+ transporter type 2C